MTDPLALAEERWQQAVEQLDMEHRDAWIAIQEEKERAK